MCDTINKKGVFTSGRMFRIQSLIFEEKQLHWPFWVFTKIDSKWEAAILPLLWVERYTCYTCEWKVTLVKHTRGMLHLLHLQVEYCTCYTCEWSWAYSCISNHLIYKLSSTFNDFIDFITLCYDYTRGDSKMDVSNKLLNSRLSTQRSRRFQQFKCPIVMIS